MTKENIIEIYNYIANDNCETSNTIGYFPMDEFNDVFKDIPPYDLVYKFQELNFDFESDYFYFDDISEELYSVDIDNEINDCIEIIREELPNVTLSNLIDIYNSCVCRDNSLVFRMSQLDNLYSSYSPTELMKMTNHGAFNVDHEFFREINGKICSYDDWLENVLHDLIFKALDNFQED